MSWRRLVWFEPNETSISWKKERKKLLEGDRRRIAPMWFICG